MAITGLSNYTRTMRALELELVVDEETARRWHAVDEATRPHDHPADPVGEVLPRVQAPAAAGERTELWVGTVDGSPVVDGALMLPVLDNEANATLDVRVLTEHRRTGYGSAMLAHLIERARAESRGRIFMEIPEPLESRECTPGVEFARALGARPVLTEVRRRLDLAHLDDEQLVALSEDAWKHADGYSLVHWVDRAPDEIVDDLAELMGRMSVDAPQEDMEWDPEQYDAARVRAREDTVIAMGRRRLTSAVRHDATGQLVGHTEIGVNVGQPRVGHDRPHRAPRAPTRAAHQGR